MRDNLKKNLRINHGKSFLYSVGDIQQIAFGHATKYLVERGPTEKMNLNQAAASGRYDPIDKYFKAVKDYAKQLHAVQEELIK